MKSSIVLASILSLAAATPVLTRDDPCACEFMCVTQVGPDCECERANKAKCYAAQIEAGLNCPKPEISEMCQLMSILPVDLPTPTPGPETKRQDEEDPCFCDYMCPMEIELGCKCEREAKERCYKEQVAAGLNCPAPTFSETCQTFSILPISLPTPTPTPAPQLARRQPPPAAEGEECGSFRGPSCAEGLICVVKKPGCADCAGICESAVCGGIAGIPCPNGYVCKLDEECVAEGFSDCQGLCEFDIGLKF